MQYAALLGLRDAPVFSFMEPPDSNKQLLQTSRRTAADTTGTEQLSSDSSSGKLQFRVQYAYGIGSIERATVGLL